MTCWNDDALNLGREWAEALYGLTAATRTMANFIGMPSTSIIANTLDNVLAGNGAYPIEIDWTTFGPDRGAALGALGNLAGNAGRTFRYLHGANNVGEAGLIFLEYEEDLGRAQQRADELFPGGGGRGDCDDEDDEPAPDDDLPDPSDDDNGNGLPDPQEPGNGSGGGRGGPPSRGGMDQPPSDPLVLDLDGDGVELVSVDRSSAYFDIDRDGFAEHVGWVAPDDGLLALDLNGNGRIDDITELFGNATENGFTALGRHDANHDGRIDQQDAVFSQLRVWRDLDGDGQTDAGELSTLAALGIGHIPTSGTNAGRFSSGNFIEATASFGYADGSTSSVAAVWFSIDQTESRYQTPDGFVLDPEAYILPVVVGYGNVKDLSVAISQSGALKQQLIDIVMATASHGYDELRGAVVDLVTDWFAIDVNQVGNRGPNVDRFKLAVVETFFGVQYWQQSIDAQGAQFIAGKYDEIIDSIFVKILVQSPLSYVARLTGITDASAALIDHPLSGFLAFSIDPSDDTISGSMATLISLMSRTMTDVGALADVGKFARLTVSAIFSGDRKAFESALAHAIDSTSNNSPGFADEALFHALAYGVVAGGAGADQLGTDQPSVYMAGLGGDDRFQGGAGGEALDGGRGNDTLSGNDGSDTYIFAAGDGIDRIEDNGFRDADRLLIHGHAASGVTLTRSGADLTLGFAGSSDAVTIVHTLEGDLGDHVEEIEFDDGTAWSLAYLQARLIAEQQTSVGDTVTGFDSREDVLAGGLGNDNLSGQDGSDNYVFNTGDGVDRIEDNGFRDTDRLLIHGYATSGVTLTRSGADLTLRFAGSTDTVTIVNTLEGDLGDHIEEIVFDDGTAWNLAYLQARLIAEQQTLGNDTVTGFDVRDDVLAGGRGNDTLNGKDGSDSYVFNAGDGTDRIEDNGFRDSDRLLIHGHAASGVTLTRSGADLTLRFAGSTDTVTIVNTLENDAGDHIEEIVFDDGTAWNLAYLQARLIAEQQTLGNDTVTGFDVRDDVLAGGRGNDTLNGKDGSDSYVFNAGDGIDRIEDNGFRDSDRLLIHGHAASGVTLARSGADLTLRFAGSTDTVTIVNTLENDAGDHIEEIVFDDGTAWNLAYLQARLIAEQQTLGNDTVTGFDVRDDVLAGGRGNDTLNGKDGSDSYVFDAGDGTDRIEDNGFRDSDRLLIHGHAASGVTLTRSGTDLTLRFAGSTDAVTIVNTLENDAGDHIEEIVFDDGTVWNNAYVLYLLTGIPGPSLILGGMTSDQLFGSNDDDSIYALDGDDVAWGGPGADQMYGGTGADTLGGDAGADTIAGGSGNDTIYGGGENDRLSGGDGADFILGDSGNDIVSGDRGNDRLFGFDGDDRLEGGEGADQLFGENGSDQMTGGAGNDLLIGAAGNDILDGGGGQDRLQGGGSADIFVFGTLADSRLSALRSDGAKVLPDMIRDFVSGEDRIDLSAIDANAATGANDAFTFIGAAAFTGQAGQLRYHLTSGVMHIMGDVDGDGRADFEIVAATPILQATDFIL